MAVRICLCILALFLYGCKAENLTGSVGSEASGDSGGDDSGATTTELTVISQNIIGVTSTGFTATVSVSGDDDGDATVTLYYCNINTLPSCDPVTDGTSQALTRTGDEYSHVFTGIADPGEDLRIDYVITDPDGASGTVAQQTQKTTSNIGPNTYSVDFAGTGNNAVFSRTITLPTNATFSVWFQYNGGNETILGIADGNSYFYIYTNNNIELECNGDTALTVSSGTTLTVGSWYHFVFSKNGNSWTTYRDGSVIDGPTTKTFTCDFAHVGNHQTLTNNADHLKGKISDLAIWNVALDSTNVTAIYNTGTPLQDLTSDSGGYSQSAGLIHWWRMGDGDENASGYVIQDVANVTDNPLILGDLPPATAYSTDVP